MAAKDWRADPTANPPLEWATGSWLGIFTLCWLLTQFLTAEAASALWLALFLPMTGTGAALTLWAVRRLVAGPDRKTPTLSLLSLAAVVVFVGNGGCAPHPHFDRADYDARIARIRAVHLGYRATAAQREGGNLDTSDLSVVRVAFPEPGGMLDNYTAFTPPSSTTPRGS